MLIKLLMLQVRWEKVLFFHKLIVGKLNFTGKPFAPDSIFINNLGKSLEDLDDMASDLENV